MSCRSNADHGAPAGDNEMMKDNKFVQSLWRSLSIVALVWLFFLADWLPWTELKSLGVRPRSLIGLLGIPASPFLHRDLGHLLSNTPALFVLLLLLFTTDRQPWKVLFSIVILSGSLVWLVGRAVTSEGMAITHIGASGVIFGMITYLIAAGLWHRRLGGSIVAAVVLIIYGGSLVWGLVPRLNAEVSWEGHLSGAAAGIIVAWLSRRQEKWDVERDGFDLGKIASLQQPPPVEPRI